MLRVVTTYNLMSVSLEQHSPSALADLTKPRNGLDLRHMMTTWSARYHRIPLRTNVEGEDAGPLQGEITMGNRSPKEIPKYFA